MSVDAAPLPAVVLAAGASTRMGTPKALLRVAPDGATFLESIVSRLGQAGCAPLVVVTRAELVAPIAELRLGDASVVVNPDPSRGQLSSLLVALASLGAAPDAVLVTLVDVPLVRGETIVRLRQAWQSRPSPMIRPVLGGRHGHPVIFGAEAIEALKRADPALGAKPIVRRFAARALDIEVEDEGVLLDIDTREDYQTRFGGA